LQKLLRRFLDVCNAIAYAHSREVLHRDLKPDNIMVGQYGETLVVDWGLAKVVGTPEASGEATLLPPSASGTSETLPGSAIGAPAYMSPEQAAGELHRPGPASDVYSLGATLYSVLTGRTPFEKGEAGEVLSRVQRGEFPPPRQAQPNVPRALEAICLKAMALRPADRYANCRALADDLERWLADEPVSAWSEPWPERLSRWGRHHRSLVATAVAVLGTATVGLAAGLWVVNAERARTELARQGEAQQRKLAVAREKDARDKEQEARDKEAEARAVLGFVQDKILAAARPEGQEGGLGREVTLRKALEAALPQVESSFRGRPLVEASVRMTLGQSFSYLGDAAMAERQFQLARECYAARLGPDHRGTLLSMVNLAASYHDLGRLGEALKLYEETLALMKSKLGPDHPETLGCMRNLASNYHALGRLREALKLREETLALMKAKLGPDHRDTRISMNNLANSYADLGRHAEALKLREETLALMKVGLGPDHPETLGCMYNLANSYYVLDRHVEALKLYEETLAMRETKLGPDHRDTLTTAEGVAVSYHALGRHAEALKLDEKTLAVRRAALGPDHPDTLKSMRRLANGYASLGRDAEALRLHEETLALMKAKLGPDHPDTLWSTGDLAGSLVALGRSSEAVALVDDCLIRAQRKPLGPRPMQSLLYHRLRALAQQRDASGCRQTAEMLEKLHCDDAPSLYYAACFRAITAGVLRADARTTDAARQADAEGDKALGWLTKAVAAGYDTPQHLAHMTRDADLDSLRDRDDFRRLMAGLMDRGFPADPFAD
jgi:non-specific serine/threonine protein kinase/serine/threonine-protein kinase